MEIKKDLSNKRAATKASLAKKILRKNITVNTKMVFNDDGEVLISS